MLVREFRLADFCGEQIVLSLWDIGINVFDKCMHVDGVLLAVGSVLHGIWNEWWDQLW